jgi:hypothetical protein
MSQVFRPNSNYVAKWTIVGVVIFVGLLATIVWFLSTSSYATNVGRAIEQPVPFSHKHHVQGVGLDCRYCHATVETSASAGMPSTEVCMTCHSQLFTDSPLLKPVRDSWATGQPLEWNRVHNLGDFVYFNHSVHLAKGMGCTTCHGQVDQMPLMWKENTLTMGWCLGCHTHPENFIRPKEEVFNVNWRPSGNVEEGKKLVKQYHIEKARLTNCWLCHR